MLRTISRTFALVLVAFAGGCGPKATGPVYAVPAGADSELALIKNSPGGWFAPPVYVASVDGVRVDYPAQFMGTNRTRPVRVTPGEHTLSVIVELRVTPPPGFTGGGTTEHRWTFRYPFAAGHVYNVRHVGAFNMRVRITDETAGEVTVLDNRPSRR